MARGHFPSPDAVPPEPALNVSTRDPSNTADTALVDTLQKLAAQLGQNEAALAQLVQHLEGVDSDVDTSEIDAPARGQQAKRNYQTTKRKRPDLRIFDLLAGLAVRYGHNRYLHDVIAAVQSSPPHCQACFSDRVEKWRAENGNWRRRWADREHFIKWHRPIMAGMGEKAQVRTVRLPPPDKFAHLPGT
jgi:hypothetical protein